MSLTKSQIERYSRQLRLPEVGDVGQKKLLAGKVLVVGAGGLGCPAGLYLTAAGVGTIGIMDGDVVDLSNLQRQVAHAMPDIGRAKVESAAEKFRAINPDVVIHPRRERLTVSNALRILREYDFVINATDGFESKFLVADACHFARKPYSQAGILGFEGQTMTVCPGETACYRCLFDAAPAGGDGALTPPGVMGSVAGMIGVLQATEAIKFLLGQGELLTNRLLVYESLRMSFRTIPLKRNPRCPLCGESPTIVSKPFLCGAEPALSSQKEA